MEIVGREPRVKYRKIILKKNKIFHDIDSLTFKLAETAAGEDLKDHVASDTEDALDGSVISKLMDAREATLRKKLAFCMREEVIYEIDNEEEIDGQYEFSFVLPVSFRDSELKPAMKLMQDYMVQATLMDWYKSIGTSFGGSMDAEITRLESRIIDIFRVPGFVSHPSVVLMPSYKIR